MSFFLQNNFSEFKKKSLSKSDLSLFTIFLSAILLYNTHTSNTLQIFNHDNVVKHEFIFKNAAVIELSSLTFSIHNNVVVQDVEEGKIIKNKSKKNFICHAENYSASVTNKFI